MSVNLLKQRFPQLLTALDRAPMAGLLCAAALLFGVTLAWTRSIAAPHSAQATVETGVLSRAYNSGEQSLDNTKTVRLREGGEIVNQAGYFRTSVDRVAFVSADNSPRFITLENHNLEQVLQAIAENTNNKLEWIVSGTISEFHGANFLLITRAELKSRIHSPNAAQ